MPSPTTAMTDWPGREATLVRHDVHHVSGLHRPEVAQRYEQADLELVGIAPGRRGSGGERREGELQ